MKLINALLLICLFNGLIAQEIFQVNAKKSQVLWHAEKVTGTHDGTIDIKSGVIHITEGKFSGGAFVLDMTSIKVTDMDDPKYNEKLGRHLMSPDFFSAAVHETSKFEIDRVVHQGKDRYKVEGNMTIKGITNRNKFIANIKVSKDKIEAFADIVIDRAEYDVRYGSGSFIEDLGDKTIYDEFSLKVTLLADKK